MVWIYTNWNRPAFRMLPRPSYILPTTVPKSNQRLFGVHYKAANLSACYVTTHLTPNSRRITLQMATRYHTAHRPCTHTGLFLSDKLL